jgi:hypothetical protein
VLVLRVRLTYSVSCPLLNSFTVVTVGTGESKVRYTQTASSNNNNNTAKEEAENGLSALGGQHSILVSERHDETTTTVR